HHLPGADRGTGVSRATKHTLEMFMLQCFSIALFYATKLRYSPLTLPKMYEYRWIAGKDAERELLEEMVRLYSTNYGIWGPYGPRPGEHIKISLAKLQQWLSPADSHAA